MDRGRCREHLRHVALESCSQSEKSFPMKREVRRRHSKTKSSSVVRHRQFQNQYQ